MSGRTPQSEAPETGAPETLHVETIVHGRSRVRAAAGSPAPLLLGFHGYGENAQVHLEALGSIPGTEAWHLAAVQGLNRFYNTRTGDVIASWMTKEDRELTIADNLAYVAASRRRIAERLEIAGPTVIAGFSQGTAMAYRAAAHAERPVAGLVALAGDVPPELAELDLGDFPRVLIGRGSEDDWYDEAKLAADLELLEGAGVKVEVCRFDGGHVWTPEFRDVCGRFLAALAGVP